jgi:hypothetical protein
MASYKEIFEVEKQREGSDQWNVIHLFREGNTYKAYEWSAWLCREFAVTDEQMAQAEIHRLKPVHKEVKSSSGTIIFVGFPATSLSKFIPDGNQMSFNPVSDTRIDVAIELPPTLGEMSSESLQRQFSEWKKQFPTKGDGKQPAGKDSPADDLLPLAGTRNQPMRMSDILAQIVALPVEDITPNEALKVLRILKRQCSALF